MQKKNQHIMNFARTFLKVWLWFLSFVNLVLKYCTNLVYIYFLRAKQTWESIETLPWKLNRFGPECAHVPLFTVLIIFKSGWGQGISIFFSNSLNFQFLFTVLSVSFLNFQYIHVSLAVLVLEMFLVVLYFHSCGIVGIMMVMIKLAHLCCLWIVCWMWALGFVWHSEEKTQYMNSRRGPVLRENAVVSPHSPPWMLCAKKPV